MHETSTSMISQDLDSLNDLLVNLSLDELDVEALEQRIELSLAVLFGSLIEEPSACGQFSCTGYWPAA